MTLGEKIKYYRKQAGFTQKKLAEELDLAVGTIQQYEYNKRVPSMKRLEEIAVVLNINFLSLIEDDFTQTDSNEAEEKLQDIKEFEHSTAQLLFLDEFKDFQYHLDAFESKKLRNETAKYLFDIFKKLNHYFNILQKERSKGDKPLAQVYLELKNSYSNEILLDIDKILNTIFEDIERGSIEKKIIMAHY